MPDKLIQEVHTTGSGISPLPPPAPVNQAVPEVVSPIDAQYPETVPSVANGQWVHLDPEATEKNFRLGKVEFNPGQIVHVQTAKGDVIPVPAEQVLSHLEDGGHITSARAYRDKGLTKEYGNDPLLAAALGDANAATAGIFGNVLRSVAHGGLPDKTITPQEADLLDRERFVRSHHPVATGLGEGLGVITGAALTGGGAALEDVGALGASKLLPAAAEEAPGLIARLAPKVGGQSLRAAVENAAIGHTDDITEENLGAPKLTAEKYVANRIEDMALGGMFGAGGAIVGEGVGALYRGARNASGELLDNVVSRFTKAPEPSAIDKLAKDAFDGYAAKGVGEAVVSPAAHTAEATAERSAVRETAAKDVESSLDELDKHADALSQVRPPTEVATEQVPRTPSEINDFIKSNIQNKEVQDWLSAGADVKKMPDVMKYNVVESKASLETNAAREKVLSELESAKAAAQKLWKPMTSEELHTNWTKEHAATGISAEDYMKSVNYGQSPDGINNYVAQLTNPEKDEAHQALLQYASSVKNAAELSKNKEALKAASSILKKVNTLGESVAKVNQVEGLIANGAARAPSMGDVIANWKPATRAVKAGMKAAGTAVGFGVGHGFGGVVGYQAGKWSSKLAELGALKKVLSSFDNKIGKGIDLFFARSKVPAEGGALADTAKIARGVNRGRATSERSTTRSELERNMQMTRTLADPALLPHLVAPHASAISSGAPQTAGHMSDVAVRAAAYLDSVAPKNPADPLTGQSSPPTESQMMTYNLQVKAVVDPASVVDDLAKGRVSKVQIDALKATYPEIYKELQAKVQESIVEHVSKKRPFTLQQRTQLGILMNLETDKSLSRTSMKHADATYSISPQHHPDTRPAKGTSRAKEMQTPEQRMVGGQ